MFGINRGTFYKRHMKSDADLTWMAGDAPYSRCFGDRYFSSKDGQAETRAVFLAGNGLPERWHDKAHFHIAELGFGTGLNFLETLALWQSRASAQATLTYTSFELYPLMRDEMARALANWPDLAPLAALLLGQWPATSQQFGNVSLELIKGDARKTLPQWNGTADAWYLDGFSPAKNPQLWEKDLMQNVFDHTSAGGSFSTYTAAGFVRRNLQEAGFTVERMPGHGNKRERLQGQKPVCNSQHIR